MGGREENMAGATRTLGLRRQCWFANIVWIEIPIDWQTSGLSTSKGSGAPVDGAEPTQKQSIVKFVTRQAQIHSLEGERDDLIKNWSIKFNLNFTQYVRKKFTAEFAVETVAIPQPGVDALKRSEPASISV